MPVSDASLALPLALFAAALAGGTILTYSYDRGTSLPWRLVAGACTGTGALGLIGLGLASWFGLQGWVIALAGLVVGTPAGLLLSSRYRAHLSADLRATVHRARSRLAHISARTVGGALACAAGGWALWRVADRTMFVRPDGIYTGVSHNIGDLPFHLSVMSRFVYGHNLPPEHPSFAGVGFTYPFLTDFIGAMFVRAGLSARAVMVWSTWLFCVALGALLYRWTLDLTGRRDAAFLAPVLAFLNGGVGWWRLAQDAAHGAPFWSLLGELPHDYTITSDNAFRWGNVVTTLLVTQRGLLLGLPLAVIVFHQWWLATSPGEEDRRARQARMIAAGVMTGLLPLIHAHSYAVVVGMAACLALLSRDRGIWVAFFAWSLAIGLPQVWWMAQLRSVQGGAFLAWSVGWDHGQQNVVLFWLKNTGLLLPLILVACLWRGSRPLVPRRLLMFYLPFTLCFIVPNLVRLAPWIWDNIKVLTFWFLASVPVVALLLARLAQGAWWRGSLAMLVVASLTLAGALDVWRVASGAFQARVFDRSGLDFAALVSEATSPTALVLHAAVANHPVALTGRRSLMGYPGHVWSHGLEYGPREADIRRIYSGGADAEALLRRYGIDYVVIGPLERGQMPINDTFFGRYREVGQAGGHRLYDARR